MRPPHHNHHHHYSVPVPVPLPEQSELRARPPRPLPSHYPLSHPCSRAPLFCSCPSVAYLGGYNLDLRHLINCKVALFALSLLSRSVRLFSFSFRCVLPPNPRAILLFPVFLGCIVLLLNACILCLRPTILLDQPLSSILLLASGAWSEETNEPVFPTHASHHLFDLFFLLLSLFASAEAGRLWGSLFFISFFISQQRPPPSSREALRRRTLTELFAHLVLDQCHHRHSCP